MKNQLVVGIPVSQVSRLETYYGYPAEKMIALRQVIKKAQQKDNQNIKAGLQQFELACAAVASASLAYPIIALGAPER